MNNNPWCFDSNAGPTPKRRAEGTKTGGKVRGNYFILEKKIPGRKPVGREEGR